MNIKDKKIFSNFKNEDIDIKIDRKLNSRSRNQCPLNKLEKNNNDIDEDNGVQLNFSDDPFEYNILIYINNLE